MECTHPIDNEIRANLRAMQPNQPALAEAIGRSQAWLSKYMAGRGHATIDDIVRIAAHLLGVNLPVLTATESRLLTAVQALEEDDQLDVLAYALHRARLAQRGPSRESSAPTEGMPLETKRRVRGKR
jgi:transcriptional regulator with XRE-family HTH domain